MWSQAFKFELFHLIKTSLKSQQWFWPYFIEGRVRHSLCTLEKYYPILSICYTIYEMCSNFMSNIYIQMHVKIPKNMWSFPGDLLVFATHERCLMSNAAQRPSLVSMPFSSHRLDIVGAACMKQVHIKLTNLCFSKTHLWHSAPELGLWWSFLSLP